ncbi:hypothetical protein [Brevundimonas sp. G8]|uniref:hypothetical protein n=1 Tax=Brevundimonas sp. G8 TaxID=1350776 RepID=UPI0012F3B042|nr:hypothetical protein [Brevundimonas sp. G8]VXA98239.1 conserved hypothetical protein [Brevundimonas sp. G8]
MASHVALRALGAMLLVLCLSFLLFGLGFYGEGMLDLADGRMNGHASLHLSESVALHLFWRRIRTMLGLSAVLLLLALACFWAASALKPKP